MLPQLPRQLHLRPRCDVARIKHSPLRMEGRQRRAHHIDADLQQLLVAQLCCAVSRLLRRCECRGGSLDSCSPGCRRPQLLRALQAELVVCNCAMPVLRCHVARLCLAQRSARGAEGFWLRIRAMRQQVPRVAQLLFMLLLLLPPIARALLQRPWPRLSGSSSCDRHLCMLCMYRCRMLHCDCR
jgi:hypothetical protein